MIELKNINKSYGKQKVLKDLNLSIKPGQITGIVGENGAGKTTLFSCLCGLETFSGEVKSNYSPIKNHIGYLPAENFFFDRMTGFEYLALMNHARNKTFEKEQAQIFDLPLNKYVSGYSTGMKKKLALLAIILQNPEILILDEPFNGLDINSCFLLTEIIKKLKQKGKTIILCSHVFQIMKELCDSIAYLNKGGIQNIYNSSNYVDLEETMKNYNVTHKIEKLLF